MLENDIVEDTEYLAEHYKEKYFSFLKMFLERLIFGVENVNFSETYYMFNLVLRNRKYIYLHGF